MNRVILTAISSIAPIGCSLYLSEHARAEKYKSISPKPDFVDKLPTRSEMIDKLKNTPEFDVLIIGGGATGSGVALDASTRGMKVALVEMNDYASGASSKSTKLIHGGVRYLEKAFLRLDKGEFDLVKEALKDRRYMLDSAPHLASEIPLMIPVYSWWKAIYFWAGIKVYDLVSLGHSISSSYLVGKNESIKMFPDIKSDGLVGSIVYYDGQHNDARMNLSILISAIKNGAACSNYIAVESLMKKSVDGKEIVTGATLCDKLTGEKFDVKTKILVNATGCFTDSMRKQIDSAAKTICKASSGVHVVIPEKFCPSKVGLLDPETSDQRVLFVLPWEGRVVVGTTDQPCEIISNPTPTVKEIKYILDEVNKFYRDGVDVQPKDILSAWSGIRPLVTDPKSMVPGKTSTISRNHVIERSGNTVTISGGKWTTYRSMAEDTVNEFMKIPEIRKIYSSNFDCVTRSDNPPKLHGADGWSTKYASTLKNIYQELPDDIAQHLSHNYGSMSSEVLNTQVNNSSSGETPSYNRLSSKFPFIEQEVIYACRKEYACKAVDVLSRRIRLAFLDTEEAMMSLPRVVDLMAAELHWDSTRKKAEMREAVEYFENDMGLSAKQQLIK